MPRLKRSDPTAPGLTRRKSGKGFTYLDERGERLTDQQTLERIKALVIPPAWTQVWISPHPHGHIQAIGTDDAGRRQYLYHSHWHTTRGREKYLRAESLGRALPTLRRRLRRDLDESKLTEQRVMACAVRLLDLGVFRVGSEQYAKENDSFGLATIRREHVRRVKEGVAFEFPAKSGQLGQVLVTEPRVTAVLTQLLNRSDDSPELLAWWDRRQRRWTDVKSGMINDHLKQLIEADHTAKDFRTWHGSVMMAMNLSVHASRHDTLTKKLLTQSYREVAEELGNTPAVVRSSYVDPRVVDLAERGKTIPVVRQARHELVPESASKALLLLLDKGKED